MKTKPVGASSPFSCPQFSCLNSVVLTLAGVLAGLVTFAEGDLYSVRDFGAKGDGKTDDTAAFQKALDAAGQAGGGVVYAPRGNYFFAEEE